MAVVGPQGVPLSLHINIFTSIGRGAYVELKSVDPSGGSAAAKHVRSTQIIGGGVDLVAEWLELSNGTDAKKEMEWVNGGCAYQAKMRNASLSTGSCDRGNHHRTCLSLFMAKASHCTVEM